MFYGELHKIVLNATLLRRGSLFNAEHVAGKQQHARPNAKREWRGASAINPFVSLLLHCYASRRVPSGINRPSQKQNS